MKGAFRNKAMTKQELRQEVRTRRKSLDPDWRRHAGGAVQVRAIGLPEFAAARTIGVYLPLPGEVDTSAIIAASRSGRKTVVVPAFKENTGAYAWCRYLPGCALCEGTFGVLEPERPLWAPAVECDVIFVPGLAFDADGGRVGFGRGYFDRLLAGCLQCGAGEAEGNGSRPFIVGLAFEFQVYDKVPMGRHDVRLHAVVTEKRTVGAGGGEAVESIVRARRASVGH